jgi:hypothetical protein
VRREFSLDPFHAVVDLLSFKQLVAIFILCYLLMMLFFGLLFYGIASIPDHMDDGFAPDNTFWTCLQCAWQSVTTVGYGTASPVGPVANVACALAVVISVVLDSVGIGVFFQRMTHAGSKARSLIHSQQAVIRKGATPGERVLECRVHHMADHALVDPTARLTLVKWHSGHPGSAAPRVCLEFQDLELANATTRSFLQYPWSLVHTIGQVSPLRHYHTREDLARDNIELVVMVLGTAAATGNGCEYRASYKAPQVEFGCRFVDVLRLAADGSLDVNLADFHTTVPEREADAPWRPQCC